MITRKLFSFILFIALVGYGCTDLNETLTSEFTESWTPNNPGFGQSTNVNGSIPNDGLNAAYSAIMTGTANNGGWFHVNELASDEMVIPQRGGDWYNGGVLIALHTHEFQAGLGEANNMWNDAYNGITQVNTLLGAGGLDANKTAQLRVVRAYFHWRLMDAFGRVKIQTQTGVSVPQSDRPAVYQFIIDELEASIPDLAPDNGYARAGKYAAHALAARVYLNAGVYKRPVSGGISTAPFAGDYTFELQKAIEHTDAVINSGLYELDPNFADVFAPDNVGNPEHIWVLPYDEATGAGMNFAQMSLHYPSQLTFDLEQQPWNGYSSLESFYNSFDANDKRRAASFIVGPQTDLNGNPIVDVAFDKADPDGPEINFTPAINELFPNASRQAGARLGKFSNKVGQRPDMDNDFPIIRFAEMHLIKAEATARLNSNWSHPTTLALVNILRERAGVSPYTSLTADEFLAELGREKFQEVHRRTDQIRMDAWGDAWDFKPAHSDRYKEVFPIPQQQLNATTDGSLSQNPGY
jgi:hypothetical protein